MEARRGCYGTPQVPEVGYLQKDITPIQIEKIESNRRLPSDHKYMAMPFSHELESCQRRLTCLGVGSEEPIEFSILCFWKCS
jgi:hypothetical protein